MPEWGGMAVVIREEEELDFRKVGPWWQERLALPGWRGVVIWSGRSMAVPHRRAARRE